MTILNQNTPKKNIHNVRVGSNVKIYDFVNLYGCSIGDNTKIGTFVEIQKGVVIGKNCKISSHSFICEGVSMGNGVFIGHQVAFINDKYPKAINPDGSMQTEKDWTLMKTLVKDEASIGTGAVILGGITIGKGATVGAGSVVTKDVEDYTTVVGNPAKLLKTID